MTSLRRPGRLNGVGAWLLAVLTAVGVLVFGAGTASARPLPDGQTRVRACAPETITAVGVSEHIVAGQGRGPPVPAAGFVVATGVAAKGESSLGRTAARACSFAKATLVLMADGTQKPIDQIKVGDKVLATDPETGEQAAKRVEHVFVHDDALTDLVLADGTVLATTEDHPYWSVDDQKFERADQLAPGEKVLGADGRTVGVSGLKLATTHEGLAYNLAVDGIHTYHVGGDAILVHNDCGPNLIYEANPKHGAVSRPGPRGEISRAPRGDCQAMLECSTLIKPQLREGVEPETGLTVIFRRHREFDGTEWWHGYVPGG